MLQYTEPFLTPPTAIQTGNTYSILHHTHDPAEQMPVYVLQGFKQALADMPLATDLPDLSVEIPHKKD